MISRLAGALLLTLIAAAVFAAGEGWRQVIDQDGVVVSTRAVDGSDLDEFRGVVELAAPLAVVAAVVRDVPGHARWMDRTQSGRVVRVVSERSLILYHISNSPWPIRDRDLVTRRDETWELDDRRVFFRFRAVEDSAMPPNEKYVRLSEVVSSWELVYLAPERTRTIYTSRVHPGGAIPVIVANSQSKNVPFNTLRSLRRMVATAKYRRMGESSPLARAVAEHFAAATPN